VLVLGFTIFASYIGVGIVVPMFPFFGAHAGAPPEAITAAMAITALGQLVSTPFWGWASDRVGRKPVLLVSLLGGAAASALLGFAESVPMLLLSRLVAGLMSGIGAVAFAAVADVAEGAARARGMGRVGAASSLGFILGPALGGLIAGSGAAGDFRAAALVAAGLDLVAFALALLAFRETRPARQRLAARAAAGSGGDHPRRALARAMRDPPLRRLAAVNLLFAGAFAIVDSTLPLFAARAHEFTPAQLGYTFTAMGAMTTLVQGVLLGRIVQRIGAAGAVRAALAAIAAGHLLVAASTGPVVMLAGCALLACSLGLFIAPSSTLVAARAAEHERGAILGVFQGAGNLGRVLTPLASGVAFAGLGMGVPFVGAALLALPAFALLLAGRRRGA
jgi:DHA1 family tetracycline resistance protein-like MFS transporter